MLMAACAPSLPPITTSPTVLSCKRALAAGGCLASPVPAAPSLLVESSRVLPPITRMLHPAAYHSRARHGCKATAAEIDITPTSHVLQTRALSESTCMLHPSVGNGSPPTGPLGDHGFQDIFPLFQSAGSHSGSSVPLRSTQPVSLALRHTSAPGASCLRRRFTMPVWQQ